MTAPVDRVWVEVLPMFKNFNEKLKSQVTAGVSGAATEMEKVNQSVGKTVAGVNEQIGKSSEKISKSVEKGAREAAEHSEGLFSHIKEGAKDLLFSMGPLAAGFGIVEFLKGSFEAADEAIKLSRQTAAVVKSTGEAAHVSAKDVEEYATRLSEQTGVVKDTIVNNENLLLTFTNIKNQVGKGNDIFRQATGLILDMSVALKEDGKSASIQLGKALNDPIKGITALSRVGVSFTEQQKKTIKSLVEHNNVLGAQKIILGELSREFGGSAAAQATAGQKLKASYHEVETEVGGKLIPIVEKAAEFVTKKIIPAFMSLFDDAERGTGVFGALRHVFETLETTVKPIVPMIVGFVKQGWKLLGDVLENNVVPALKVAAVWIDKHGTLVRTIVVAILAAVTAMKVITVVTRIWAGAMTLLDAAMDANPIGIVIIAIAALAAGFIYAYKHSEAFRNVVNKLASNVVKSWNDIKTNVTASIHDIVHNVTASWNDIKTNVTGSVHDIIHNVTASWNDIVHNVSASVHDIVHNVTASWNDITHNVTASLRDIKNGISGAWNWVIAFLRKWGPTALIVLAPFIGIPLYIYHNWDKIKSYLTTVWNNARAAVVNGVNVIIGWLRNVPKWIYSAVMGTWAGRLGYDIINGIWTGIKNLWNTVVGWFGKIPGWIKSALGIHSPPIWAVDAGGWIVKGLIKGLTGGAFTFANFLGHFTKLARDKLTSFIGSIGGGFVHPSGALLDWIHVAEKLTGVNDAWTPGLLTLIGRESGGNPNAINNWDINAQHGDPSRGLMQTIGATFAHYHQPGTSWNIYDPVANISAGIRYILARYGGIWNVQQADPTRPPHGYATGAWRIPHDQLAYLHASEMVVPAAPAAAIRAAASNVDGKLNLSDETIEKLARAFAYAIGAAKHQSVIHARRYGLGTT